MNTMPLEADTRLLVDTNLANLGWSLTGKNKNVFVEQPRTEEERKQLKGKRPDYVLYSKESERPLIIIEAKKKGEKIDKALEQGIEYARALNAPLVFATDGVFCKAYHTGANRTPILNGEEIDVNAKELEVLKCLLDNNGQVLTRMQIIDYVWKDSEETPYDRVIDVYIKELRKKLQLDCITTIRNVGYKLERK